MHVGKGRYIHTDTYTSTPARTPAKNTGTIHCWLLALFCTSFLFLSPCAVTIVAATSPAHHNASRAMAHIHVCRHGQDMDNVNGILNGHRDEPLSDLGRSQAAAVAEKIKQSGVAYAAIYASPLQRAFSTASAIGAAVGVAVEKRDDLIERDFGVLSGRPYADIPTYAGDKVLQGDRILYFLAAEGCETFDKCYERAQGVLADVDAKHPGQHVLLVCHGDIGKMLQAARAKVNWEDGLRLPYFANTEVIEL